jgi:allantoinase
MTAAWTIKSRRVVLPEGIESRSIRIEHEKIVSLDTYEAPTRERCLDYGDLLVLPGLVDTHVHINEPGRTHWEGFETATQAAAAGGITTLVDMPLNCSPVTTSPHALKEKICSLDGKLFVDCGFWGGVVPQNVHNLQDLLTSGVLGVKSFLIDSGIEEFPAISPQELKLAMAQLARHKLPYLIHAELNGGNHNLTPQGVTYADFLASRPDQLEVEAIGALVCALKELKAAGKSCPMHIVHLSSAEALPLIAAAKAEKLSLTVETCPHYLTLEAEAIPQTNALYKCCPPIRGKANRQRLWQGLASGTIDFIVSDHSPCTDTEKRLHEHSVKDAWGGISSLQFNLPLIWQEAHRRNINFLEVVKWLCQKPAVFCGLGQQKGKIAVGYDADLVVFDECATWTIQPTDIRFRNKMTPYQNCSVRGKVKSTYLRGECVLEEDEICKTPTGKPLLRRIGTTQ